jgi:hypothetical protein
VGIRHRQMRPKDVLQCVDIVAAHPILSSRYGSAIADLRPAWLRLLGREAFRAVVFEEISGPHIRILGTGITVFVSDEFMRDAKTPPLFWIGPELVKRVVRGNCPLLSDEELREANSGAGLNLVVWQVGMSPENLKRVEVTTEGMNAFMKEHRGFLIKELIVQPESVEHLYGLRNVGALLRTADGSYEDFNITEPGDFLTRPCILGSTREKALTKLASWTFPLFVYEPPKCGFSLSEQRMLLAALDGGTDEELAAAMQMSVSAVKKKWRSIYDRVGACLPELLPHALSDGQPSERGREKKQRLLTYLRDHLEELRPVSRRFRESPSERKPHGQTEVRS